MYVWHSYKVLITCMLLSKVIEQINAQMPIQQSLCTFILLDSFSSQTHSQQATSSYNDSFKWMRPHSEHRVTLGLWDALCVWDCRPSKLPKVLLLQFSCVQNISGFASVTPSFWWHVAQTDGAECHKRKARKTCPVRMASSAAYCSWEGLKLRASQLDMDTCNNIRSLNQLITHMGHMNVFVCPTHLCWSDFEQLLQHGNRTAPSYCCEVLHVCWSSVVQDSKALQRHRTLAKSCFASMSSLAWTMMLMQEWRHVQQ